MNSIQPGSLFAFAFSVTLPIFAVVAAGAVLKRTGIVSEEFIRSASSLVFNIGLPVTLFVNAAGADFSHLESGMHLVVLTVTTLTVFGLSALSTLWLVKNRADRGVYIQGAFRGNLVVVGLAFCGNAYGPEGIAVATVPVGVMVILYNVLSVYILQVTLQQDNATDLKATVTGIIKNPLIAGIVLGVLVNVAGVELPDLVLDTGGYFSQMALPLALLCIGGSLDLSAVRHTGGAAAGSSIWKVFVSPLAACLFAVALGIRGMELAILFLLAASPTAAASFIMARAMGGNAALSANIIALSTLGAVITVTGGLMLLKLTGLI